MIEGAGSKVFKIIKSFMYQEPEAMKLLLQRLTDTIIDYLNAQVQAGANALMVFDTWGGVLSQSDYFEFSLKYMTQIANGIQRQHQGQKIPLIFFTKNSGLWLEQLANSGCDAVGLDWQTDIGTARQQIGNKVALQGNLDPFVLFAKKEKIRASVAEILKKFGPNPGHVFNLGHGIDQNTPIEGVEAMIETVLNWKYQSE